MAEPGATAQRPQLSHVVLAHAPRQPGSWLIWDVRQSMKSPDGSIEVLRGELAEVRMGSPLFGSIDIPAMPFRLGGRAFGEATAFSPDSRFFAIAELVEAARSGPISRVIVFDFKQKRERVAKQADAGLIKSVEWSSPRELKIVHWVHVFGDQTEVWTATTNDEQECNSPWWRFW